MCRAGGLLLGVRDVRQPLRERKPELDVVLAVVPQQTLGGGAVEILPHLVCGVGFLFVRRTTNYGVARIVGREVVDLGEGALKPWVSSSPPPQLENKERKYISGSDLLA